MYSFVLVYILFHLPAKSMLEFGFPALSHFRHPLPMPATATGHALANPAVLSFSLEFSYNFTRCVWVFLLWPKENIDSQKKAFYFSRNLKSQRPRVPRRRALLHGLRLHRMEPLVRTALQSPHFVPPTAVPSSGLPRSLNQLEQSSPLSLVGWFTTHGGHQPSATQATPPSPCLSGMFWSQRKTKSQALSVTSLPHSHNHKENVAFFKLGILSTLNVSLADFTTMLMSATTCQQVFT